ncbi:minor capsid protein [Alkalicoccobacillus porphyridii]|nr:minor capsid protein [Alkalicoccobacillus porphyridii]
MQVRFNGVKNKFNSQALNKGRTAAANQMLADMNRFVPKDDNILRTTGHATTNGKDVLWNTPYAARLFYMPMYNYTTPGTGPRWDLKAKGMFMSDWIKAYTKGAGW